ncbi:MAG: hypothetical protein J0I36_02615, partial [Pandoraea sp.]|nr:hypothetical protein [Pandoraea sp.]
MKAADLVSGPKILVHQTLPSFSIPEWVEVAGYHGIILDLQHGELGVAQRQPLALAQGRAVGV